MNPEEVVGTIIPNVYISRITLESGGFVQSSFRDNPHIDPTQAQKNAGIVEGGKTYAADTLNVTLQLTLKDAISNNLSKWFAGGELPFKTTGGTDRKTLKDYIKVVVIRTTTSTATQAWSREVAGTPNPQLDTLRINDSAKYEFYLSELEGSNILDRHYKEYDSAGNSVRSMCKNILPSVWEDNDGNDAPPLSPNPQNLAYFAWAQFDLQTFGQEYKINDVAHLATLLTSAGIMIGKVKSDLVFKDGALVKNSSFYVIAQIVPPDPASSAPIKVTPTNHIWVGEVHRGHPASNYGTRQDPIYYAGADGTGAWIGGTQFINPRTTPFLVRKTVPNTKIQDFRIAKRIDKLNLSLSHLENKVLRIVDKNRRSVIERTKFSYFTDIHLSRDKEDNCRFFFGMDLRKMVRENSVYGKLFMPYSGWLDEAMNNVRIISMRVFRKRVQGSSELGDSPFRFSNGHEFDSVHKLKKFSSGLSRESRVLSDPTPIRISFDPSDELIIEAGEVLSEGGGHTLVSDPNITDGRSMIKKCGPIYSETSNPGIHYYTGVDGGIFKVTDGYYQYRIELEIQDNSVTFLLQQQQALSTLIDNLEQYFQIASAPGINGIRDTTRGDPHTTAVNQYASRDAREANFDPIINRFTQSFIDNYGQTGQMWETSNFAQRYLSILSVFVNLYPQDHDDIRDTVNLYTEPQTGNLQGCLLFLGLLRKLMSVIESAIGVQKGRAKNKIEAGTNATGQTSTLFESNIEKQGSPKIKTFKINHTFASYYNGNIPKNTGFDFLGTGLSGISEIPAGAGLRVVTADDFKNIIVPKEIHKIFKSPQSPMELRGVEAKGITGIGTSLQNTDFSYLTPAIVKTPNKEILMVSDGVGPPPDINAQDFINTAATIGVGTSVDWSKPNSLQEKIADFLSYNYDLVALPTPEPTISIVDPGDENPNNPAAVPLDEYKKSFQASNQSNFQAFDIFWDLISSGLVSEGARGGSGVPEGISQRNIGFYNPDNNTDGFMKPPLNLTATEITNLPNPIKALIRSQDNVASPTGGQTFESPLKPDIENFLAGEPFSDPILRAKARILFETIGEIQVFTGFGTVEYGNEQQKLAISEMAERGDPVVAFPDPTIEASTGVLTDTSWRKLTRNIYGSAPSSYFLCRIRRWENSAFKIQKEDTSEFPIYEEYFLLEGSTAIQPDNTRRERRRAFRPPTVVTAGSEPAAAQALRTMYGGSAPSTTTTVTTNPRTDYISSNWAAENIMSNARSTPPAGLMGSTAPATPGGPRPAQGSSTSPATPSTSPGTQQQSSQPPRPSPTRPPRPPMSSPPMQRGAGFGSGFSRGGGGGTGGYSQ